MKEEKQSADIPDKNENPENDIERKLGELLLRGWIMTSESCPIERK
jgi:hypothetical protein